MPRLVVVSIPNYNKSWWWGFGIPRTGLSDRCPSLRRRCLARARGERLNAAHSNDVGLRVKGPNDSYLQPGPLFRQSLRIQLIDLVRSLQHESSASIISLCDLLRE